MASTLWSRIKAAAKRLEARGDAWAQKRLSPEEYDDAVELDKQLKRNFWVWCVYFAAAAGIGALIVMGTHPNVPFLRAWFYAALMLVYVMAAVASAWYGYRKWACRPMGSVLAIFVVLMVGGFAVGTVIATLTTGKSFAELNWEKIYRGTSLSLLMGVGIAAVLLTIARLRQREVRQRAARMQAEAERERFARQSAQAELKMLQAQVEPHFLFNTLANLRHLVQTKSEDALPMLDHLVHYLRTSLPEIRAETSTVGREAELARAYLEILRIRMGGALEYTIDVPGDMAHVPFPPLMLITLVENAVKHGLMPQGRGQVTVRATRDGATIRMTVDDDGRGLQEPIGQGLGLANVRGRLQALFGGSARLDLSGRDGPGTRAVIELPA